MEINTKADAESYLKTYHSDIVINDKMIKLVMDLYDDARQEGYDDGREAGYDEGYESGYSVGVDD